MSNFSSSLLRRISNRVRTIFGIFGGGSIKNKNEPMVTAYPNLINPLLIFSITLSCPLVPS